MMSVLDRILLRLFAFIGVVFAIWLGLWLFGMQAVIDATRTVVFLGGYYDLLFIFVVFVLGLRFLLFPLTRRSIHSFVKDTEAGEVRISYVTVRELASRAARQVRGVERIHTAVDEGQNGLVVAIRVRALTGVDLTVMCSEIQETVSQAVMQATSLKVAAVHVQVADLSPELHNDKPAR